MAAFLPTVSDLAKLSLLWALSSIIRKETAPYWCYAQKNWETTGRLF